MPVYITHMIRVSCALPADTTIYQEIIVLNVQEEPIVLLTTMTVSHGLQTEMKSLISKETVSCVLRGSTNI